MGSILECLRKSVQISEVVVFVCHWNHEKVSAYSKCRLAEVPLGPLSSKNISGVNRHLLKNVLHFDLLLKRRNFILAIVRCALLTVLDLLD